MTDQSAETANRTAQEAAGPPPSKDALGHSGLADQPLSYLKKLGERLASLVGGGTRR